MNEALLLNSLQYLEDELIEEAACPAPRNAAWRRWGAAAACLVLLAGAGFLLRQARKSSPASGVVVVPGGTGILMTEAPQGMVQLPWVSSSPGTGGAPVPGGRIHVPGGETPDVPPAAVPIPDIFAWTEAAPPYAGVDTGDVILVGQELTEAQLAACAPGIRLEWMEDFSGAAVYRLADGSGGLSGVELNVAHGELGNVYHVTLREATAESLARFGLDEEALPRINGQGYRAFREYYSRGDGERVSILVAFARENVLYTLSGDVPIPGEKPAPDLHDPNGDGSTAEENAAATDLRDLLLAYAGTHAVPDLGSFVYGGGSP